jgi:hypothetical protein
MANSLHNHFKAESAKGNVPWLTAVLRCLLVDSSSTYVDDPDHDFLSGLSGLVEVSTGDVASYARQTLGTPTAAAANNKALMGAATISFGNLEAGATVKGYVLYVQVGGDDTTPANDIVIGYFDTAAGATQFPVATSGGAFSISVPNGIWKF